MNKTKKKTRVTIWYIVTHTALVSALNLALYLAMIKAKLKYWTSSLA